MRESCPQNKVELTSLFLRSSLLFRLACPCIDAAYVGGSFDACFLIAERAASFTGRGSLRLPCVVVTVQAKTPHLYGMGC